MLTCDHGASRCGCLPRRGVLAIAGAALAGGVRAQAAPHRIDVHHHLSPPAYLDAVGPQASPPTRNWTPARSLEDMDRAGVATAMLSITTPGLWFGDAAQAARLARACNEYAAGLVQAHPGRFGSFAALPLPDIDASLAEIAHALDVLKADGVTLFTSYGGKWLGDPAFAPVLEELNRRRAVVYTHPASAACCVDLVPGIPDPAIEFGTDTTRTIAQLLFSGAAARWPELRLIFSHAGGTMPFLIERFEFLARDPAMRQRLAGGAVLPALRRFHYDTAQVSNPVAMGALLKLVPASQVVFGTDYPFRTSEEHVRGLAGCGLEAEALRAIERDNALAMLPRLRG